MSGVIGAQSFEAGRRRIGRIQRLRFHEVARRMAFPGKQGKVLYVKCVWVLWRSRAKNLHCLERGHGLHYAEVATVRKRHSVAPV